MRRMKLATSLCSEPRTNGSDKYATSTAAQTRPALLARGSCWVATIAHFPYRAFASTYRRRQRVGLHWSLAGASGEGWGVGGGSLWRRRWKRGGGVAVFLQFTAMLLLVPPCFGASWRLCSTAAQCPLQNTTGQQLLCNFATPQPPPTPTPAGLSSSCSLSTVVFAACAKLQGAVMETRPFHSHRRPHDTLKEHPGGALVAVVGLR
jgi:hypothetical protein